MIQINLQYLAYPFWIYAAWKVLSGAVLLAQNFRGPDMMPAIAINYAVNSFTFAAASAVIGWLVWRAFRS